MTTFSNLYRPGTIHAIEKHSDPTGLWIEISYRTDYRVLVTADVEEDWNAYSKAWHRSYGPKRTTENRRIEFYSQNKSGEWVLRKTHALDSFRGQFLAKAIAEELGVPTSREKGFRRRVQLNDLYRIEQVADDLYVRTIAGAVYDYVAVKGDEETYHAPTADEAREGLARKLEEAARLQEAAAKGELISARMGRRLGFCEEGMREFARAVGLKYSGEYTIDDFAEAVRRAAWDDAYVLYQYHTELRTLASHVGREDLAEKWDVYAY